MAWPRSRYRPGGAGRPLNRHCLDQSHHECHLYYYLVLDPHSHGLPWSGESWPELILNSHNFLPLKFSLLPNREWCPLRWPWGGLIEPLRCNFGHVLINKHVTRIVGPVSTSFGCFVVQQLPVTMMQRRFLQTRVIRLRLRVRAQLRTMVRVRPLETRPLSVASLQEFSLLPGRSRPG